MVGFSLKIARKQKQEIAEEHVELLKTNYSKGYSNVCSRVVQSASLNPRHAIRFAIVVVLMAINVLVLVLLAINFLCSYQCNDFVVENKCRIHLVESIPENLVYNDSSSSSHLSTFDAWMKLLKEAKHSVDIVSFYWTLRRGTLNESSAWQGEKIFEELFAIMKRGVKLRIIQDPPSRNYMDEDTKLLASAGAKVLNLNMSHFFGSGVLHTKLWVVDGRMFYLGSANMDWRSLTQVKELGVLVESCRQLVDDVSKLVEVYVYAATKNRLPYFWTCRFRTCFNKDTPHNADLNDTKSQVYFSSSPPEFCPPKRTTDIDAILDIIQKAKSFINIAVMDYSPTTLFLPHNRYWPVIDDAIRTAVFERKVQVRFMASLWSHTKKNMIPFLKSLAILDNITSTVSVKLFCVPSTEEERLIPYARVNHNKYMVTEDVAYIGTSNWSGDYFINTAGVSMILNQTSKASQKNFHSDLLQTFMRDWSSEHTIDIWDVPSNFSLLC